MFCRFNGGGAGDANGKTFSASLDACLYDAFLGRSKATSLAGSPDLKETEQQA